MVVHDPGDWFDETLASLVAQDYTNLRTLFLLTPSSDAQHADLTARIRALLPAAFVRPLAGNAGFGPSANEVLRLVEGDNGFFLICHDDIALDQRAVRLLVNELFRSNAGVVGPKLVEWDQPRTLQHVGLGLDRFGEVDPLVESGEVDQEQHDAVRDVFVIPSACMLIRADLMRAMAGFDPTMSFHGEDVDLCWRAHLTGARVVVAPDARVRHREQLVSRRPDLNHRTLSSRHRMRSVATLTGGSRLLGRSIQLVLLTLVEVVVGLFTGRLGDALASLRALIGLVPRTGSILARRRAIRGQRVVPEREVLGLQDRGSSRLNSYLRGRDVATFVGSDTTVRRWRETSFGPVLAWFCVIVAMVIGSRSFIRHGVPAVGEFLPYRVSASQLMHDYRSSFDSRSFGSTTATPTGWMIASILSAVALFRLPLFMTMSVIGLGLGGALGAWRLATVFPSNRARVATMVVYVGSPLLPGVLGQGDYTTLVWFAACPWLLHLVRTAAGIATADPSAADVDLIDGVAPVGVRHRIRAIAFGGLTMGIAAGLAPITVALFAALGVLVVAATVLAGGRWRVAAWQLAATAVIVVLGLALNLPWALQWSWPELVGAQPAGASGRPLWRLATLGPDTVTFGVLGLGLMLPLLGAMTIARAWRLTWAVRAGALVIGFGAAAVAADRGWSGLALPRTPLLLVPVVLGLAIGAGALAGAFGTDVMARGFGWRQPVAVLANAALVVGLVPGLLSIGDGAWRSPSTPLTTFLDAQLPVDTTTGDYRVLYLGDPMLIPVPAHEYRPGIAYAVTDAGPLDFEDRFVVEPTTADAAVERTLMLISEGSTLRVGRLLAPLGIRYVIIPKTDGVHSTDEAPTPVPGGLVASLQNQLDLASVPSAPSIEVFTNEAWMPVGAQLTGTAAEASRVAGEDVIVRSDLSGAVPSMLGVDGRPSAANEVAEGVVHIAIPFDPRLTLTVGDAAVAPRPGFGVTTAFDIPARGIGVVGYRQESSRSLWLAAQAVLWLAVLLAAAGMRTGFTRRRAIELHDETLIDLSDEWDAPDIVGSGPAGGVAGEVLGASGWGFEADESDPATLGTEWHTLDDWDAVEPDPAIARGGGGELAGSLDPATDGSDGPAPHDVARDHRAPVTTARPVPVRDTTPPDGVPRVDAGSPEADRADLASLASGDLSASTEPDEHEPDEHEPDEHEPDEHGGGR